MSAKYTLEILTKTSKKILQAQLFETQQVITAEHNADTWNSKVGVIREWTSKWIAEIDNEPAPRAEELGAES